LGNVAFGYWSKTLDGVALEDALMARYRAADNLTDRRAVLSIASRSQVLSAEFRRSLFAEFYETWQDHALVIDLWFNLQAQSPQIDIDGLQALVAHPAFDQRNPNRARSVYGAFGMLNNRRFHALDGSGYEFLGQAVAVIDGLNPQLAARLATPLTRLGRYDLTRQRLMRNQLQLLSDRPSLSKDLYDIVTKSLA
jgi:aminopeptidase N